MNDLTPLWVVTGGASGIGLQLVEELRELGAQVIVWDRADSQGDDYRQVDLLQRESILAAAAEITGPVACFVHCAGATFSTTIAARTATTRMREAYELHVIALITAIQALAPMLAEAGGSVVALSSAAGENVYPGTLGYGASKAALQRVVQQVAVEMAPLGVRINAIAPGAIASPMTAQYWNDPEYAARRRQYIPMGFQGKPADVSGVIRFLASPEAGYITGQTIRIDGGAELGTYSTEVQAMVPLGRFRAADPVAVDDTHSAL